MYWKRYKALADSAKLDESYYIIGLDIGNDSSAIAFYNLSEKSPESIDLSGGYGKPSIPTVVQYISDTKEWVFGEYAILNRGLGTEITLNNLVSRLGRSDYIDVDHKTMSIASVLALFLKELLSSVRNINPKAEIVGIVAAVPAYLSEQAHEEFQKAFSQAGYEKELIALVPDRECVFAHHYNTMPTREECALLLDFGSRELRGGLYQVIPTGDTIQVTAMSSVFDESTGSANLMRDVHDLFKSFLFEQAGIENTRQLREQVSAFTYQHKDILFQKNIRNKPVKLYYNFAYPPFQKAVAHDVVEALVKPYSTQFTSFIKSVLEKNLYEMKIRPADVTVVICAGGGFDMLWARDEVTGLFSKSQLKFSRNSKLITAEGAALVAARLLAVPESGAKLTLVDKHQFTCDIGISDGKSFLSIVEHNTFWWQTHPTKLVLVNAPVTIEEGFFLDIVERSNTDVSRSLARINLDGLQGRPKGVTRLEVKMSFSSNTDLTVNIRDMGFGELFPKTDFKREMVIRLG